MEPCGKGEQWSSIAKEGNGEAGVGIVLHSDEMAKH